MYAFILAQLSSPDETPLRVQTSPPDCRPRTSGTSFPPSSVFQSQHIFIKLVGNAAQHLPLSLLALTNPSFEILLNTRQNPIVHRDLIRYREQIIGELLFFPHSEIKLWLNPLLMLPLIEFE